mmetsp:Transcript_12925/g.33668  ORF Transcript_12925/g.33668 Transcript_12925/m.33668 type:complete len:368 (-) Transcript_12925:27-1130(-)
MLDIAHFRSDKWGDVRVVRESQRRRRASVELADRVAALDHSWRELCPSLDRVHKDLNEITRKHREGGRPSESERTRAKLLKAHAAQLQQGVHTAETALLDALLTVGNLVHQDSPHGQDADGGTPLSTHPAATATTTSRCSCVQEVREYIGHALRFHGAASGTDEEEHETKGRAADIRKALHAVRTRLPARNARLTAGGAVHGCLWLEGRELPAWCVFDDADTDLMPAQPEPEHASVCAVCGGADLWVVSAGDPYSSWECLEKLREQAAGLLVQLGIGVGVRDVPAHELAPEAARTYDLHALGADGCSVVGPPLARCTNHTDYLARAHGLRFQGDKLRDHQKRYVHTSLLSFAAPDALLQAIVASDRR